MSRGSFRNHLLGSTDFGLTALFYLKKSCFLASINARPGGEIGLHARLKIVCRKACGFESHPGHQYQTFRFLPDFLIRNY